jgi:hypothetical protein
MDIKTKLLNLYRCNDQSFLNTGVAFFSFKIVCVDTTIYKPKINIFIPYLDTFVQQSYIFHNGWQQFSIHFHHIITDKLNPCLQIHKNNSSYLEIYKSAGSDANDFYQEIVDVFEYYKIIEYKKIDNDYFLDSPISLHSTIQECNMRTFNPPQHFSFTHREGDLYSGSAYLMNEFDEPINLGSFYHMSKEILDKNIKCLFL